MKAGHTQKKWTATKWTENCWGTEKEWIDFSKGDRKILINSQMKPLFLVQQSPTYFLPYTKVNHVECKPFGLWHSPTRQGLNARHIFSCAHHTSDGGHKALWSCHKETDEILFLQTRDVHFVLFQTDLLTPQYVGLVSGNTYLNYHYFKSFTLWELHNNVF